MKIILGLIAAGIFTFSFASAQSNKKQLPGKPLEQKEIKGDRHLEKEMQQKQLSDKPELLEENISAAETKKTTQRHHHKSKKNKSKQIKTAEK